MEMTAREIMTRADGQLLISTGLHGQAVRTRSAVRSIPDPQLGNCTVFAESDGITEGERGIESGERNRIRQLLQKIGHSRHSASPKL
jgi:hypothetical protein